MKQLVFVLFMVFFLNVLSAQDTGKAYINGVETSTIDLSEDVYQLSFNITEASIKGAWMAKAKNFQYAVTIKFLQDGECELGEIHQWQDAVRGTSLASLAKDNSPIAIEADGMKFLITNAIKDCSSLPNGLQVAFNFLIPNKSGELFSASQIILNMPEDAKNESIAQVSDEAIQLFSNGLASDSYSNQTLNKSVESYMERKWPSEDVTTVHLTSQKFTNIAQSTFDLEGYYITKTANGICKYNSFYCEATKNSGRYTITLFNSMDAEKTIDCRVSVKFQNL